MSSIVPRLANVHKCSKRASGSLASLIDSRESSRNQDYAHVKILERLSLTSIVVMQRMAYTTGGSVNAGSGFPPRRMLLPRALGGELRRG